MQDVNGDEVQVEAWAAEQRGGNNTLTLEPGQKLHQQHSTDSSASAKLVVVQRRRRSLGTEERKAKDCFREPGQEHAETP